MNGDRFELRAYLASRRQRVDAALEKQLRTSGPASRLEQAMGYSVMAGGKRLRPILCIAAAEAVGGDADTVMPIAVALEWIHTYSLIHDDLPAMDDDATRRGNPTCHIRFDEATAILAGDALLNGAFEILARGATTCPPERQSAWLAVIARIASAAGHEGMIEGQMRDMAAEGTPIDRDSLEALHRLKTGRLIEVSAAAGAMIAGADEAQMRFLSTYAGDIGLAFQVADDILNVTGDPDKLGKATGSDQARGKNTYPALMGLAAAQELAADLVNNSLKALTTFDRKADPLRAIARYVIERKR